MGNLDARVRYTRMMIENSFMALLEEKSAARITVTEICQLAQINRATFYKHYLDVPDLLEQIEQGLLSKLTDVVDLIPSTENLTSQILISTLEKMLRFVKENANQYMILGGANGDPSLAMKTFNMIIDIFDPLLHQRLHVLDQANREMLHHYLTLGCGGALMVWIKNGMKEDCREMAEFLLNLSMGATSGLN